MTTKWIVTPCGVCASTDWYRTAPFQFTIFKKSSRLAPRHVLAGGTLVFGLLWRQCHADRVDGVPEEGEQDANPQKLRLLDTKQNDADNDNQRLDGYVGEYELQCRAEAEHEELHVRPEATHQAADDECDALQPRGTISQPRDDTICTRDLARETGPRNHVHEHGDFKPVEEPD